RPQTTTLMPMVVLPTSASSSGAAPTQLASRARVWASRGGKSGRPRGEARPRASSRPRARVMAVVTGTGQGPAVPLVRSAVWRSTGRAARTAARSIDGVGSGRLHQSWLAVFGQGRLFGFVGGGRGGAPRAAGRRVEPHHVVFGRRGLGIRRLVGLGRG